MTVLAKLQNDILGTIKIELCAFVPATIFIDIIPRRMYEWALMKPGDTLMNDRETRHPTKSFDRVGQFIEYHKVETTCTLVALALAGALVRGGTDGIEKHAFDFSGYINAVPVDRVLANFDGRDAWMRSLIEETIRDKVAEGVPLKNGPLGWERLETEDGLFRSFNLLGVNGFFFETSIPVGEKFHKAHALMNRNDALEVVETVMNKTLETLQICVTAQTGHPAEFQDNKADMFRFEIARQDQVWRGPSNLTPDNCPLVSGPSAP
ncbi:MAG: hypothetical protein EOM26_05145 [Alphaproteobacteria bacterium]|nr:hypothetical protein [Alphaproteobacteria bacterium]